MAADELFTVRTTLLTLVMPPPVAAMSSVYIPAGVELLVFTVRVVEPWPVTEPTL